MKFFVCLVFVSALVASAYTDEISVESKSAGDSLNLWEKIFETEIFVNFESIRTRVEQQAKIALQEAREYLKDTENKTKIILNNILERAKEVKEETEKYAQKLVSDVSKDVLDLAPHKKQVEKYIELSKNKIQELREQLISYIENPLKIAEEARKQAEETWEDIQEKARALKGKVPESWKEFQAQAKNLSEKTKKQVEELKQRSKELKEKADEALEDVQDKVLEMTKEQLDVAKEYLKNAKEQAKILRQRTKERIEELINETKERVEKARGKFEETMEKVKNMTLELQNKGMDYWGDLSWAPAAEEVRNHILVYWIKAVEKATKLRLQAMEQLETVKAQAKDFQADTRINMDAGMQRLRALRELAKENLVVAQEHLQRVRGMLDEYMKKYNLNEYWLQFQQKAMETYGKLDLESLQNLKEKMLSNWGEIQNWIKVDKDETKAGLKIKSMSKKLMRKVLKLRPRMDIN